MKPIGLLLFFLGPVVCTGQGTSGPEREAFDLKLFVNDSNFYQTVVAAGPYFVADGVLQIYPGERVFIQAERKRGELHNMRVVEAPKDTTDLIRVAFWQISEGRQHSGMMLSIQNPFDGDLHYEASAFFMEHAQWGNTSTVPVRAGLGAYETWPDVIVTLALSGWKITPAK